MDAENIKRIAGPEVNRCFLCKWIMEDLRINGRLTGYPTDHSGSAGFPVVGKLRHLELEQASLDRRAALGV